MWKYFLMTALVSYLLMPGVVTVLPSLGPLNSTMVHALVFAAVHVAMHKMLRS